MDKTITNKGIKMGFILVVIAILVISIIITIKLFILNTSDVRIMTGNLLYGTSANCDGKCGNYGMGGDAMTSYNCGICKKSCMNGTTNTPKLCDDCAKVTNRHNYCGKLLISN